MYTLQCFISILLLISLSYAIQCPKGMGCDDCQFLGGDEYEIQCLTSTSDSMFIVTYKPHSLLRIECSNSKNWSEFHLGKEGKIQGVNAISFWRCGIPEGGRLGEITRQLITDDIKELSLQLTDNLTFSLTKETLAEFQGLETLILTRNELKNVTSDLLRDLKNLKLLNLRENELRELPKGFLDLEGLESIELGSNKLEVIEPEIFDKLGELKLLNLWNNKLIEIKPKSFDRLKSLKSLDMHANNLGSLPEDIFVKLENLRGINLSQNNFSKNSLPGGLLRNNSLLENVRFFENKQNLTTFPSKFFGDLPQLRSVNIRRNKLVYLPEDLFKGSGNLQNLSMEWNFIEKLPRGIFEGCRELLSVKMGFNELRELPDGVFLGLKKLVELDLSRNHIMTINERTFDDLLSLKILNMENNGLKTIHPNALQPLPNLRIARFSSNQLTLNVDNRMNNHAKSPFYPCEEIEELHLANNNISEIFYDWTLAPRLRVLSLRNNSLQYLHATDIFFSSEKLNVDLSSNKIERISLARAELLANNRSYPKDVIISIENNPINCDCDLYDLLRYREGEMDRKVQYNVHLKMSNLTCHKPEDYMNLSVESFQSKTLKCRLENPETYNATCPEGCECYLHPGKRAYLIDCSYKNLTEAPKSLKSPRGFDLTIELNLTGNFLKKMPLMTQNGYDSVKVLSLSKNGINSVPLEGLSRNLQVLNLDSNNLTRLETSVLNFLKNSTELRNLTLQKNPWACDCDSREFLSFIQQKKSKIPELQEVHCDNSETPIFEMTPEEMCPLAMGVIIGACIGVALLGLLIGTIVALYYRFQQEIKVWLYARGWCLWFVTEDELDKDKLYDAFISYSHKDEDFVKDLIAELEDGENPFKCCVHYRDWLAGEWIPENIARSVEDSRRTVVVLSPNFLESVWGKMEFRTAHNKALTEGRARVIVILYGEIGDLDKLDPELKAYLSMNTYVQWGDPWFWKKLKYALPHHEGVIKKKRKQTVFENQQPTIVVANDKSDLIKDSKQNGTTSGASTPPADTLKTFEKGVGENDKNVGNKPVTKDGIKVNGVARNCSPVKANGKVEKLQCTTV